MMRGALLASFLVFSLIFSQISYAQEESVILQKTSEIDDAPNSIWADADPDQRWQVIFVGFEVNGSFSDNDSIDVFAIKISSINGTRVEMHGSSGVKFQIQTLNQTNWKIERSTGFYWTGELDNWNFTEANLSEGYHAIRIEKQGHTESDLNYSFRLFDRGPIFLEDDGFEDLSWMFRNFYIFAGMFLIFPLLTVVWWNKHRWIGRSGGSIIDLQEIGTLASLKKRFADTGEVVDEEKIERSLASLGEGAWAAFIEKYGSPSVKYKTENSESLVWVTSEPEEFGVGIKVSGAKWEMAAIRAYSPDGSSLEIIEVEPEHLFQKGEVFLDSLEPGKEYLLKIRILDPVKEVRFHLSGIVEGEPIASYPTGSIKLFEEE